MSYTKGQWIVMGNQRNGHFDFVLPCADDKDFQANARLIAAAPDLLAACKELLDLSDRVPKCSSEKCTICPEINATIDRAKQAIQKAESE